MILLKAPDFKKQREAAPSQAPAADAAIPKELLDPSLLCEHGRGCPAPPLVLLCDSDGVGTRSFLARFCRRYQMVAHLYYFLFLF